MNIVLFIYAVIGIVYFWIVPGDIPDSVIIGFAILIGCFMISENLVDIKDKINKEVK